MLFFEQIRAGYQQFYQYQFAPCPKVTCFGDIVSILRTVLEIPLCQGPMNHKKVFPPLISLSQHVEHLPCKQARKDEQKSQVEANETEKLLIKTPRTMYRTLLRRLQQYKKCSS